MFSYQTRIRGDFPALDTYAELYGKIERTLFSESIAKGIAPAKLKNAYLKRFGIPARMFNAVRMALEGKASSIIERRAGLLKESDSRIKKAKAKIKKLSKPGKNETPEKKTKRLFELHQKKRRLAILERKNAEMSADDKAGKVRITFGSNKLFHAQHNLEANGYKDHAEWLEDWKAARSSEIYIVGSKDETAGCQLCTATLDDSGESLILRVRLPDALKENHGKYLTIPGVVFSYGFENIKASLSSGIALTYRFKRDVKGWRVFVSTEVKAPEIISRKESGMLGVDFNADHLAIAVVDRTGNFVYSDRLDITTIGADSNQRAASIGDAVKNIVSLAVVRGIPIGIEKLDFAKKKAELESVSPKMARVVSAMAYSKFHEMLQAAAFRAGIEVIAKNPAYTSTIGAVNYAQRYGISVHCAAALAIARRALGLSEKPSAGFQGHGKKIAVVPTGNGGHIAFSVPERKRGKHEWTQWAAIRREQKAAHVAHYRSGERKRKPARLAAILRPLGAIRSFEVESLNANRQESCSPDVVIQEALPW